MLQKLVHIDEKKSEKILSEIDWITDPGDFNHLPKPYRKATWHEYWHVAGRSRPDYTEFRQVQIGKMFRSLTIEWYFNCAFAILQPQKWTLKEGKIHWQESPKYYLIGCDHEYRELSHQECHEAGISHYGNCWHVNRCDKCDHVESYDSSD
ncbi:MAG: hypothetical protein DWQ19_08855 [Crenarchaeota archaeon]|nr:MAG: hypothetical protein DWQ19_08855 [Thermoproteota archaeon]